jgi:chromosomal replication initiation ATPase DnaA
MMEITSVSSLSEAYWQSQQHHLRQQRIKNAAFTPPLAQLPHYSSIFDVVMFRVCDRYHVHSNDIMSQRRRGNIVKARHAAIVMLDRFTRWTAPKIASKMNKDPSTIFYVLQKQERSPVNFSELERQIRATIPLIDDLIHS